MSEWTTELTGVSIISKIMETRMMSHCSGPASMAIHFRFFIPDDDLSGNLIELSYCCIFYRIIVRRSR